MGYRLFRRAKIAPGVSLSFSNSELIAAAREANPPPVTAPLFVQKSAFDSATADIAGPRRDQSRKGFRRVTIDD